MLCKLLASDLNYVNACSHEAGFNERVRFPSSGSALKPEKQKNELNRDGKCD